MARKDSLFEDILDLLVELPWWVSVCFAAVVYVVLRFFVPATHVENPAFKGMIAVVPQFAWLAAVFLLPAPVSAYRSFRRRRLLDGQEGIASIRSLGWKEFEQLLAEAYRRQGYAVRGNTSPGPDGGVDLRLQKDGNLYLVQCKQWLAWKVGVKVVREMFGVMGHEHATGVIIVTSGMFTEEAKTFARAKPIDLVAGNQLVELIRSVQVGPAVGASAAAPSAPRQCPQCGRPLVVREARRGQHAGSSFWGCTGYPGCRYTENCVG